MDYHSAYSTADRDGSHAMSGGPVLDCLPNSSYLSAAVKGAQDPTPLSMIAASATNLEALMPRGTEEHQDQAKVTAVHEGLSQQPRSPKVPMVHHGNTNPTNPGESAKRQRPQPGLGPLASPPSPLPGLVNRSTHETCGSEKAHGRVQKVRGKFTDSRRQEVQDIRKKGACIRCRMLRKTVRSGLSPSSELL